MKRIFLLGITALFFSACQAQAPMMDKNPETPIEFQDTISSPTSQTDTMVGPTVVILSEQSNSNQSGTATLEEIDGQVKVTLNLTGGSFTAPQPAHIHVGACPKPGEVQYPLTNVENGTSVTQLAVDMTTLKGMGPLAINVHRSTQQLSTYTACGDLPTSPSTGPGLATPAPTEM